MSDEALRVEQQIRKIREYAPIVGGVDPDELVTMAEEVAAVRGVSMSEAIDSVWETALHVRIPGDPTLMVRLPPDALPGWHDTPAAARDRLSHAWDDAARSLVRVCESVGDAASRFMEKMRRG